MSTCNSQKVFTGLIHFREDIFCHQDTNEPVTGTFEQFHDNGQLEWRKNYIDGKEDGLRESFWDNGQLNSRGNFIDGELDGLLEVFEENGNLTRTETYRNGRRVLNP